MKIKLYQVRILHAALASLDGFMDAVTEANGKQTKIFRHYEFGRTVTWNKVKNLSILRRKIEEIEEMRKSIAKKHSPEGAERVPDEAETAFNKEFNEHLDQEEEIDGLLQFSAEDLNLFDKKENPTGNRIAATTLDALEIFIKA